MTGRTRLQVAALVRGHDQRLHIGRLEPQCFPAHLAALARFVLPVIGCRSTL